MESPIKELVHPHWRASNPPPLDQSALPASRQNLAPTSGAGRDLLLELPYTLAAFQVPARKDPILQTLLMLGASSEGLGCRPVETNSPEALSKGFSWEPKAPFPIDARLEQSSEPLSASMTSRLHRCAITRSFQPFIPAVGQGSNPSPCTALRPAQDPSPESDRYTAARAPLTIFPGEEHRSRH